MIADILILVIVSGFVVAAWLHGKRNSRRSAQFAPNPNLLGLFYSATMLFALCVLAIGSRAAKLSWIEAGFALLTVIGIHVMRAHFERSMDPLHGSRSATIRFAMDALANASTIVFALFVTAAGNRLLAVAALVLGVLLILKELKFRVEDDVEYIDPAALASIRDKGKRLLHSRRAKRRDFFANYIKSYFYITLGFAILYRVAAIFIADAATAVADNGTSGVSPAWDALWFSVKTIALASAPGHVLVLQVLMGLQFLTSLALATQILFTVYRSSQS